jgi:hypothetical protein
MDGMSRKKCHFRKYLVKTFSKVAMKGLGVTEVSTPNWRITQCKRRVFLE